MKSITIQTASPDSARRMAVALSRSHPSCLADGCEVVVSLSARKGELVAVLDALAEYVTAQATGPAQLSVAGHNYVMEADANVGQSRTSGDGSVEARG